MAEENGELRETRDDLGISVDTETLGEISRLAGILNTDVGTDVESLFEKLSVRLESPDSMYLLRTSTTTELLKHLRHSRPHAPICNMLGDGLVPSNSSRAFG